MVRFGGEGGLKISILVEYSLTGSSLGGEYRGPVGRSNGVGRCGLFKFSNLGGGGVLRFWESDLSSINCLYL